MESLSTNASISPLDDLISLTQSAIIKKNEDKTTKTSHISAKVESSMKKSLEALMRFKRMNSKWLEVISNDELSLYFKSWLGVCWRWGEEGLVIKP